MDLDGTRLATCSNCQKEAILQTGIDTSIGWREIRHISGVARDSEITATLLFCSWSCIEEFAGQEAYDEKWMFGEAGGGK